MFIIKKLYILVAVLFLLVGCGNDGVVKGKEFTFTEEEFIEVYEEVNNKKFPDNIYVGSRGLDMGRATKEEAIQFLNAVYEITKYEDAKNLMQGIQDGEAKARDEFTNGKMSIVFFDDFHRSYWIGVYPYKYK